jgi:hypothetical protein
MNRLPVESSSRVSGRKTKTEDRAAPIPTTLGYAVEHAVGQNQCATRGRAFANADASKIVEHNLGPLTARGRGWYEFEDRCQIAAAEALVDGNARSANVRKYTFSDDR